MVLKAKDIMVARETPLARVREDLGRDDPAERATGG
jgi:hypothetical protein